MSKPTALITGATDGIGRAIAFTLGADGYHVGVCARTASRVESLLADLAAHGISAAGCSADVADPQQIGAWVERCTSALGPPDVLVNNAGIGRIKPFADLTLEDWDATMRTNLRSLFVVTQAVLPAMRLRKTGTIVNMASLAGHNGFVGGTAYAASKHAVLGFSRSLLPEIRKDGVRVMTICPGSVDTPFFNDDVMLHPDRARILKAEDVAAVVRDALRLPARALVSEIDLRPADP